MGDKKKKDEKPKRGKKLELNKETVKELSEQDLDRVAGGVGTRQVAPNSAGETCTCSAPPCG